jgi:hypothetical protein
MLDAGEALAGSVCAAWQIDETLWLAAARKPPDVAAPFPFAVPVFLTGR